MSPMRGETKTKAWRPKNMTRPTDLGFLKTPCYHSGRDTTLDGVEGMTGHGVPARGHFWHQTHPTGEDPEFPISEWEERRAEQAAKHPVQAEPAG